MGDRCTCHIYVKHEDKDKARELLKEFGWQPDYYATAEDTIAQLELGDVNYADLSDESELLLEHGIEHSIWNDRGGNYEEGQEHYRFTETGELYHAEYTDKGEFINPAALKEWLASGNLDYVEEKLAEHIRYTTTPEYDMTGLNAKRYLMARMVKP